MILDPFSTPKFAGKVLDNLSATGREELLHTQSNSGWKKRT
jgi:hypothetical protein